MSGGSQTVRCHFPDGSETIARLHGLAALSYQGVVTIEGHQWLWRITKRIEEPVSIDNDTTVEAEVWVEPLEIPC